MEIEFCVSKENEIWQEALVTVPPLWNQLVFSIDIPEEYALLCFVLVKDSQGRLRMLRQIGYGPRTLVIGTDSTSTTAGGVPGPNPEGTWKVILCTFAEYVAQYLENRSFLVRIEVSHDAVLVEQPVGEENWMLPEGYPWERIYQKESRWYKGDFHTHTQLSDGNETVENAMRKAEQMELDFYIPTEHNVMHTGWIRSEQVMVLPGIEITTCLGHFNIFGLHHMPGRLLQILKHAGELEVWQEMEYTIQEIGRNGWLWSVNHPFLSSWRWQYSQLKLSSMKLLEIVNDPTYPEAREANDQAILFLDSLWQDGYRIYGIGGSDSHNRIEERYEGAEGPSIAGDPGTYVYSQGLSPRHLLEAAADGHIYVSRFVTLQVRYTRGETSYLPGSRMEPGVVKEDPKEIYCDIEVTGCTESPVLMEVYNGIYRRIDLQAEAEGCYHAQYSFRWMPDCWEWRRLELRNRNGEFLAYVNPVYHGHKKHSCQTIGQAIMEWKKGDALYDSRNII